MRFDRDGWDRGSRFDRRGGVGLLQSLAGDHETLSDLYARLRIDQNLESADTCTSTYWGKFPYDRAGFDRRYTREIPCSNQGVITDGYARLWISHLLSGYADTISDGWAALLLALAGYTETIADTYARLRIDQNCLGYTDTTTDGYARLQLSQWLQAVTDTATDGYARLQIVHYLYGDAETVVDTYAMLRQIDSWTITFTGTLAAGKTVCINTRDFTVKNDGVNAIADFSGDFPTIYPGTNWVIYTDSEGSRTLKIVVSKRDRTV